MTRQTVLIAIAIFAILLGLVAIVTRERASSEEAAPDSATAEAVASDEDTAAVETLAVELYFPGTGSWLQSERREMAVGTESAERISAVVAGLLAGPRDRAMRSPLPEGVSVRRVYLGENGLVFLDFESPESSPPASGSLREMLTVYSLVNTVLLNFEELDRIVLLWNGRQLRTFAGHVDTTRPLAANSDLIARDAGRASGAAS